MASNENKESLRDVLSRFWQWLRELVDMHDYIDVDEAARNIRENVAFRGPNTFILFCAIIIASIGLNVNSIPVIIGAMLISPLMSPIVGFGMALATNDMALLKASLKNLAVMVVISVLSATLYFLISPLEMLHPSELLARTNPTIYDVLIAFVGGAAGIVETSRKERGTVIVGVAIATALMPPLCTVGFGLATMQPTFFFGASYLFFINFTFIALSAYLGCMYLGYRKVKEGDPRVQRRTRLITSILLVAIIIPSILSALTIVQQSAFEQRASRFVEAHKNYGRSYVYDYKVHHETQPSTVELYIAGEAIDSTAMVSLREHAPKYGLQPEQIVLHQDAAYEGVKAVDETEIVKDMLHTYERKLSERDAYIVVLEDRLDSLTDLCAEQQEQIEQLENQVSKKKTRK